MAKTSGPILAPLLLRLALGLTFIWAGLGKIEATFAVKGEQAALLANLGVEKVRAAASSGKTVVPPTPDAAKQGVKDAAPLPIGPNAPQLTPAPQPTTPKPAPTAPEPVLTPTEPMGPPWPLPQEKAAPDAAPTESAPRASLAGTWTLAQVTAPPSNPGASQLSERVYSASEFPDELQVARVYSLAMLIHRAGHPPMDTNAPADAPKQLQALWPTRLSEGAWPVSLAWTVALCELIAGLFVVIGLLTRFSAIVLAGTMIGAIWLTEVGPAVQTGKVVLGFIPERDFFAIDVWKTLFWQLSLLTSALALALLGAGAISLDRKLFPPPPPAPVNPKALI
ncbi:MAG: DoxX family membrane protein [Phycisphaerae bacterium]|jgi:uncharacterized membrane protein YphA (DoxX/SURF4 family)